MSTFAGFVTVLLLGLSNSLTEDEGNLWNATTFPNCRICSCRRNSGTIDCSNRNISGLLPDRDGFPQSGVTSFLFENNNVEHVPYSYFTAFPSLISIRGNRNFLAEPFLLPVTLVRLFLSYNRLTSAFAFFNRSVSYKKLKQMYEIKCRYWYMSTVYVICTIISNIRNCVTVLFYTVAS
jgi:hypothetical protein